SRLDAVWAGIPDHSAKRQVHARRRTPFALFFRIIQTVAARALWKVESPGPRASPEATIPVGREKRQSKLPRKRRKKGKSGPKIAFPEEKQAERAYLSCIQSIFGGFRALFPHVPGALGFGGFGPSSARRPRQMGRHRQ